MYIIIFALTFFVTNVFSIENMNASSIIHFFNPTLTSERFQKLQKYNRYKIERILQVTRLGFGYQLTETDLQKYTRIKFYYDFLRPYRRIRDFHKLVNFHKINKFQKYTLLLKMVFYAFYYSL